MYSTYYLMIKYCYLIFVCLFSSTCHIHLGVWRGKSLENKKVICPSFPMMDSTCVIAKRQCRSHWHQNLIFTVVVLLTAKRDSLYKCIGNMVSHGLIIQRNIKNISPNYQFFSFFKNVFWWCEMHTDITNMQQVQVCPLGTCMAFAVYVQLSRGGAGV